MIARLILAASRAVATTTWLISALRDQPIPCTPRQCGTCDHTTHRLTVQQVRAQAPDGSVPCSRHDCSGEMRMVGRRTRLQEDARTEVAEADIDGCGLVVEW